MTTISDAKPRASLPSRFLIVFAIIIVTLGVAALVGARYGLLLLIGLGLGMTLEGLRFGFAGPWRAMIERREPAGLIAQLIAIGLAAIISIPLITGGGGEIVGAHAPVGWAMVGGAFVFGVAMQLVLGCGSGTLVNAGSGNPIGILALPFFAIGSFAGSYHLDWWTGLGTAPVITASDTFGATGGLIVTLLALGLVAALALWKAAPGTRKIPKRLWIAALLVAFLAILNLVVAGQPWGVVYGLGLWAAKGAQALGADLSASTFWAVPVNAERLSESVLTDVTSLTNIGLISGAFIIAFWRRGLDQPLPSYRAITWIAIIISGLALGYSSRLAFGCNVGAFFSGVSTGSLHGWVWFIAAYIGSILGLRLRPLMGFDGVRK